MFGTLSSHSFSGNLENTSEDAMNPIKSLSIRLQL